MHRVSARATRLAGAVVVAVLGTACASATPGPATPPPATSTPTPTSPVASAATPSTPEPVAAPRTIPPTYSPTITPSDFSTTIDNPWFPLVPGTRFVYEGPTADGRERDVVEVTRDTRTVMGVTARVVHDVVSLDGNPEEETFDWYAQDRDGTVWYFGEATGKLGGPGVDTSGSFEAGVNGALPGIVMPGRPVVGDQYRQEYLKGEAEDTGKILNLAGTESAPYGGKRTDLLVTEDANPLDPQGGVENKYFARGIGTVVSVNVTGPKERIELTAVERF